MPIFLVFFSMYHGFTYLYSIFIILFNILISFAKFSLFNVCFHLFQLFPYRLLPWNMGNIVWMKGTLKMTLCLTFYSQPLSTRALSVGSSFVILWAVAEWRNNARAQLSQGMENMGSIPVGTPPETTSYFASFQLLAVSLVRTVIRQVFPVTLNNEETWNVMFCEYKYDHYEKSHCAKHKTTNFSRLIFVFVLTVNNFTFIATSQRLISG